MEEMDEEQEMVVSCAGYSRFMTSSTSPSSVMMFSGRKRSGVWMLLGSGVDSCVEWLGVWIGGCGMMVSGNSIVMGFNGWPMGYGFVVT